MSRLSESARSRFKTLAPGTQTFVASLSVVTLCFGISKVFSSIATIVVARFFGPFSFGEATIVLLTAQVLSMFMSVGQHFSVMKYGSGKSDPAPQVAFTAYVSLGGMILLAGFAWAIRSWLESWLQINDYKLVWAVLIATMFTGYTVLTSAYQALGSFKSRGIIEVAFAALLLPGLALGRLATGGDYETVLIAYAVAYGTTIPVMLWRFHRMLHPRNLAKANRREMLTFGMISCLSNFGFIATFLIQPLQLQYYHGENEVGIFRLYCAGSINTAAFATTIFCTVFFPRVSVTTNRLGIWKKLNRAWMRAFVPVAGFFVVSYVLTVLLSGEEYPLLWYQIVLFSIASTLITVVSTIGQVISSQGIAGARLGMLFTTVSGGINLSLSALLIPRWSIDGAIGALTINYAATLCLALWLGHRLLVREARALAMEPEATPSRA